MPNIQQLTLDNIALLKQLANFVETLSSHQFVQANTNLNSGSIAAHLRHIIEHYQTVIGSEREFDYDQRPRNQQLERCQSAAVLALTKLQTQLAKLIKHNASESQDEQPAILVKCATNTQAHSQPVISSIARELVFLHSHTTHHMAIIRLLALSDGVVVDSSFGKAASTKQYEQQQSDVNVQSKLA